MTKITNRLLFPLFAAVLLSLASCVPEFDNPLTDEKTSKVDPQLLGKWEEFDDTKPADAKKDTKVYWIFSLREGAENTIDYREETVHLKGDEKSKKQNEMVGPATVFTTTLDGKRYLSLGAEDDPENAAEKKNKDAEEHAGMAFIICRYEISDDGFLKIICPDQEFFGQAVATKKLPGKVEYTGKIKDRFDRVRIKAKSAELSNYLKANADACYKDGPVLTFKRAPVGDNKTAEKNKNTSVGDNNTVDKNKNTSSEPAK